MIPEANLKNNVDRFSGFEDHYDKYRPEAPRKVVEIITTYLQRKPSLVVDLGCGTGLSSFIWNKDADKIIGVEPNQDMIGKAKEKSNHLGDAQHISFVQAYSNQLELQSFTADVITCSQSFHWMEPVSTLKEVSRVLSEGGVFAAYDCDWPPVLNWTIEQDYNRLIHKADTIIARHVEPDNLVNKWSKDNHLHNMTQSGLFRFTKEIVFHNTEKCDAARYVGLALSQGGIQTVFKLGSPELDMDIEAFRRNVDHHFNGKNLNLMFSYRMRLGVK